MIIQWLQQHNENLLSLPGCSLFTIMGAAMLPTDAWNYGSDVTIYKHHVPNLHSKSEI